MQNLKHQCAQYISRINKVMDYIETHLDQSLSLDELAAVACFSPFHFHRIFSSIVGETLHQFINRIRIECAASQLLTNPYVSITEIALDTGFSSSATFARSFQAKYGMSATQWREGGYLQFRKNRKIHRNCCKTNGKEGKDFGRSSTYSGDELTAAVTMSTVPDRADAVLTSMLMRRNEMKKKSTLSTEVKIETLEDMHVAYVRHVGPYQGDTQLFENLWGRLMQWAGPRGFMQQPDIKCLNVYHDSPEITNEEKLRTSVCITVPPGTKADGEIGTMTVKGGTYALGHFEIDATQYQEAWDFVYGHWMPESGYQPADLPSFEMYLNNPDEHPKKKHIFNIGVPVKPL